MARLRIKREGRDDEIVPVTGDIVTLGRSSEATIPIDDQAASRKHAQIERFEGGYKLVDLESRNGTRVNGAHVNQHLLQWNDEIQIGKTSIVFEAGDSELIPPDSPAEGMAAAAAVAGVKPPRVHITRRRTRAVRRGAYGTETKALIAVVVVSVALGLVYFAKREKPGVVEARNHLAGAQAKYKAAEAMYHDDRTADRLHQQIDAFEESLKEYQAIPSTEEEYYRQARDCCQKIEKAVKDLKEALPSVRADEIRAFAKSQRPDQLDALKEMVRKFKDEFPASAEGAKLDALVKDVSSAKAEDLAPAYQAIETQVETFLAADGYAKALHALSDFANKHPSSALAQKAEERIKEVQAKAGDFLKSQQAKAVALEKAGKKDDAIAMYQSVITACGDESLLDDTVLQAKMAIKQLKGEK